MSEPESCAAALMRWSLVCGMEDYRLRLAQHKQIEEQHACIALSPGSGVDDVSEEGEVNGAVKK